MRFYDTFEKEHLLAAHRGWRTIRPENTLCAFEAAAGRFDFIELDLRLSRDGRYVVMHDASLERTTDVALKFPDRPAPRKVSDFTLKELRLLDAGGWFLKRDPFLTLANGQVKASDIERLLPQKIPTLEEVLAFGLTHDMPLNLEIKDMPEREAEYVSETLLRLLKSFGSVPKVVISSFNHRYLKQIKESEENLPIAVLAENFDPKRLFECLEELKAEAFHADTASAQALPVSKLRRKNIACALYTVNDRARRKEYFKKGFRALFADTP